MGANVLLCAQGPHIELCLEGGNTNGLQGGKAYSSWEGGLRVPGIAYWPSVIAPGRVTEEVASTMDIFATIVDFAGGQLPTDRIIDGKSLAHILTDASAVTPHKFLFHYCSSRIMAVRHGR